MSDLRKMIDAAHRPGEPVEVERTDLGWCVFAVENDYPIAVCGGEADAVFFAALRNAAPMLDALIDAAKILVHECCREEDCREPAEFVLWGKLLPPEALGPRCYDHAAKHVGERALGDPQWAILDLRKTQQAVAAVERALRGTT